MQIAGQLTLEFAARAGEAARTIRADFDRFNAAHPEVLDALVRLCRRWRETGEDRWSISGAYEVLRYQLREQVKADAGEPYLLNNNYRAHYARLIMTAYPDLAGIFETRSLHAD